ncbi:class I SAM-dependent methyltransferase [Teredinibacter haidensis]|uniref:class I SAM-dependent methyltransferase n=1 Tax=Teredinibacter haidensis TaxID=2731755 RepID=UPI0009491010|nr:class I SAM-dependent methyltransferase [Teredinibacter haidensis]
MSAKCGEHWSTFWQQGYITTFGVSKPHNYDGTTLAFWRDHFLALPSRAKVLDIATGNGAIAAIAMDVSNKSSKSFLVSATDIAVINASVHGCYASVRNGIEFHSNTPCEKQPFESHCFNLITSQFGFEYSDIGKTLVEVRRLLREGGRFVAISHHTDSELLKASRVELDIYREALDELDLFGFLSGYFYTLGTPEQNKNTEERGLRKATVGAQELNRRMNTFMSSHRKDETAKGVVSAIVQLAKVASTKSRDERVKLANNAEERFVQARARLKDMASAALDQNAIDQLTKAAMKLGFTTVKCKPTVLENNSLVGWEILIA